MYFSYFVYHSVARVTRVRAVALNNTAVNVSWTPVTIQETDHIFTIHYTAVGGTNSSGKNFEKTSSPLVTCTHLKLSCPAAGAVNVTAGSSSGVVDSGLYGFDREGGDLFDGAAGRGGGSTGCFGGLAGGTGNGGAVT